MFVRGRAFQFSHIITLAVFNAFLSMLATHALYENLHKTLHYKTFGSDLLAIEKQHRTVTLSDTKLMRQIKSTTFAKQN